MNLTAGAPGTAGPGAASASSDEALRDLTGLLALPALWVGRDAATVLQLTTEAVNRIVGTAVCLVHSPASAEGPFQELLHVGGVAVDARPHWHEFIRACQGLGDGADEVMPIESPLGTLRVVRLFLGAAGRSGSLWFGSSRPDFPSQHQAAFMRAAATLAATGLHAARLDQERERAASAKDEFLAMLGHELRNPLAPISTALHLIKIRAPEGLGREHQIIERQVGHLSKLVDDLLDITRITRGKVVLSRQPIDVGQLVTEAVEGISPLLEERCHQLLVDVDVGPQVRLSGDPSRLRQVLVNLLGNAAKYTPVNGSIRVRARLDAEAPAAAPRLVVEVEDNGNGIDAGLLPRIFELFEQGSTTLERAKGGLGIGLAIVKRLVEMHDGQVRAHSAGPGLGALFRVELPVATRTEPAVDAVVAPTPSAAQSSQARVLVVDDNRDAAETLGMALRYAGFDVTTTTLPQEALELVRAGAFQAAVLDIGMPVIDGYELAAQLRRELGDDAPRLIALTGYGQAADRAKALAAGFDEHMVKPIDLGQLLETLERLVVMEPS